MLIGGYLVSRCGYVAGATPAMPKLRQLRATFIATPLIGRALAVAAIGWLFNVPRARRRYPIDAGGPQE